MTKHIGVKDFYALLCELNPHLPAPEHVGGHLEVKAGLDEVSTVTIEVMVELPTKITLEEVEVLESATAWTLDGQAVTVDITGIDEETRDA